LLADLALAATVTSADAQQPSLDRRVGDIVQTGKIRVGLHLPQFVKDPATGEIQGQGTGKVIVAIAQALRTQLGVKLEVAWVVFPFQLGRADCDVVFDAIVDRESALERHVRLSKPYQVSGVAIALRPGLSGVTGFADLKKGQRVGAMVGSLASVTLGQKGLPTIPFTFEDEMIEALAKSELDAALVTPASVGYYNLLHQDAPLTLVRAYENQPELSWEIAVGMRKSDDALVAAVNEAIDQLLADGTINRIYASYGIELGLPRGQ